MLGSGPKIPRNWNIDFYSNILDFFITLINLEWFFVHKVVFYLIKSDFKFLPFVILLQLLMWERSFVLAKGLLFYHPMKVLSVPKFTANLYCICLSIPQIYTQADTVQICGKILGHSVCNAITTESFKISRIEIISHEVIRNVINNKTNNRMCTLFPLC